MVLNSPFIELSLTWKLWPLPSPNLTQNSADTWWLQNSQDYAWYGAYSGKRSHVPMNNSICFSSSNLEICRQNCRARWQSHRKLQRSSKGGGHPLLSTEALSWGSRLHSWSCTAHKRYRERQTQVLFLLLPSPLLPWSQQQQIFFGLANSMPTGSSAFSSSPF